MGYSQNFEEQQLSAEKKWNLVGSPVWAILGSYQICIKTRQWSMSAGNPRWMTLDSNVCLGMFWNMNDSNWMKNLRSYHKCFEVNGLQKSAPWVVDRNTALYSTFYKCSDSRFWKFLHNTLPNRLIPTSCLNTSLFLWIQSDSFDWSFKIFKGFFFMFQEILRFLETLRS